MAYQLRNIGIYFDFILLPRSLQRDNCVTNGISYIILATFRLIISITLLY